MAIELHGNDSTPSEKHEARPASRPEADRPAVAWALLIARLVVGVVFIAHGSQKLFGAFGGHGLAGTVKFLGPVLGYLVTADEFFGGIGLLVGFLSRFSAFWLIVDMVGAIVKVHGKNGFFLPTGFEYPLALIGLLQAILLLGPGPFSLARLLPWPRHVALE
jgi:putative oxidoreductase